MTEQSSFVIQPQETALSDVFKQLNDFINLAVQLDHCDFKFKKKKKISNLKHFSVGLSIKRPIIALLFATELEGKCCKCP